MMKKIENQILIIFGASGDLTKRMLLPSLFELFVRGLLPERFLILGTARSSFTDGSFRAHIKEKLREFVKEKEKIDDFLPLLFYQVFDPEGNTDELSERVMQLRQQYDIPDHTIYYLATPPSSYDSITRYLRESRLMRSKNGWRRIVVEKPFGISLPSARELNRCVNSVFSENEIYRIDHFLGKETVQNILVLRFANETFEALWNRNYIDHVEISALETIGIEGRGKSYEGVGALRDMIQNHLMQLLAFVAMEPPATIDAEAIRDETEKVIRALRPMTDNEVAENVVRAQYTAGTVRGEAVAGYREEKNVAADSDTETFVGIKFFIDNRRWSDVPFYFFTGKRLKEKKSEVIIHFKSAPHKLFKGECPGNSCNQLVLRINPDEGIRMKFGLKIPGAGFEVEQVAMDFSYASLCKEYIPGAYERLLLDAMSGDSMLYTRNDALEASWRFIDPIVNCWEKHRNEGLLYYAAGENGPDLGEKWNVSSLDPTVNQKKCTR